MHLTLRLCESAYAPRRQLLGVARLVWLTRLRSRTDGTNLRRFPNERLERCRGDDRFQLAGAPPRSTPYSVEQADLIRGHSAAWNRRFLTERVDVGPALLFARLLALTRT